MSEVKVNKISPRSGTTVTLGDSGDTITLASGVSLTGVNATFSGDLTVDTNTLYVDSTNNTVGIGTSSPSFSAFGSVSKGLHISNAQPTLRLEDTDTSDSSFIAQVASALYINNQGAGEARIYTNNTERMRIDSSGNVGIGTSSPNNYSGYNTLTLDGTNGGVLDFESNGTLIGEIYSTATAFFIDSEGAIPLVFRTNSASERMRIDSSGNVLVGKTSTNYQTVGHELRYGGRAFHTADGGKTLSLNRLTSDGGILDFYKDGTEVGSINASGSRLGIGSGNTGLWFDNTSYGAVRPFNVSTNSDNDNVVDLGSSGSRFKNLYLGGNIYLGGTGSANALDDYEEGTWTPSIGGTATYTTQEGTYQKVGNTVFVRFALTVNTRGTGSQAIISGLPFSMGAVEHPFYVGYFGSLQNNVVEFQMRGYQTSIYSSWLLSAGNSVSVNPSFIQDGTSILASGVYKVS